MIKVKGIIFNIVNYLIYQYCLNKFHMLVLTDHIYVKCILNYDINLPKKEFLKKPKFSLK